jgi:hypothetical protein
MREQPSRLRERVALSIPATASTRFPQKELGLPAAYPQTGAHHTSCAHRRLSLSWPPSRAVGHHHRAQRTRRSVQGCTRGGGSVGTSPAEAGRGVGRVLLPPCECTRAACADWIWGSVRPGTRRTPRTRTSPATPAARRGSAGVVGCDWRSRGEGLEACTPTPPRWPPMQELLVPEERSRKRADQRAGTPVIKSRP